MRALVVFESMFGNTEQIAAAIADGMAPHLTVDIAEVGAAPTFLDGVDLVVVGGPTHAFGMSRESTRRDAAQKAGGTVVSGRLGLRDWLENVHADGTAAAAFDTRVDHPRLPGSAARGIRKKLNRHGFHTVAAPMSFYVTGTTGPLVDGELDRARTWGDQLAVAAT